MISRTPLLLVLAMLPLAACSALKDATGTPEMSPITYPAALIPKSQEILGSRDETPRAASANSLWRNGSRTFFHDQRASHVGDILTVLITINDSAQFQNESVANRAATDNLGLTNLFGLESTLGRLLPKAFSPSAALNTASTSASDGKGSINRSEALTLTIAAVVASVLPNGNLVIQGNQEVKVNQELRQLTVAGIVRPEDITAANTINHTQIAEARVSYGGKGAIASAQNVPVGQQLVTKFSPF